MGQFCVHVCIVYSMHNSKFWAFITVVFSILLEDSKANRINRGSSQKARSLDLSFSHLDCAPWFSVENVHWTPSSASTTAFCWSCISYRNMHRPATATCYRFDPLVKFVCYYVTLVAIIRTDFLRAQFGAWERAGVVRHALEEWSRSRNRD